MDRSAIKKAYKQTTQPMGVYQISNSQNKTIFIGFASDLRARWNRHKAELQFGSHRNRQLQEMWNSLGESVFEFKILDVLDQDEKVQQNVNGELNILAEMWIQRLEQAGQVVVCL